MKATLEFELIDAPELLGVEHFFAQDFDCREFSRTFAHFPLARRRSLDARADAVAQRHVCGRGASSAAARCEDV